MTAPDKNAGEVDHHTPNWAARRGAILFTRPQPRIG
jgi:hypothetical protein